MRALSRLRGLLMTAGLSALGTAALGTATLAAEQAGLEPYPSLDWHFEGIFGTYDRASLQRGFQVYNEVCAACHGLDLLAYRNLEAIGFSSEEVKAIAAGHRVEDGPDDAGDMFDRPATPADRFRSPFANARQAAAANGGAAPPDLSLVAKRTAYGPNYTYALLTGYEETPPYAWSEENSLLPGQSFNKYRGAISMAPPLTEDLIEYSDGTGATVHQMAYDVSNFLMWAAEPHMEERKQTGIKAILFLLVFTVILYAVKRKIWAKLH